jgi:hypothetical protein
MLIWCGNVVLPILGHEPAPETSERLGCGRRFPPGAGVANPAAGT